MGTPPHKLRKLSLLRYIESRTTVDPKTGCWNWIHKGKKGWSYARHTELDGVVSVGAASWQCFFGPVPKGLDVCHECDNGHCANPMHLFLGTRAQNMQDCVAKKRHHHGVGHHKAKLTDQAVRKMKKLRKNGMTYQAIADSFGITLGPCWDAINSKSWKHV